MLSQTDAVAVALHPTPEPVHVESSQSGLEVCPATEDGQIDATGGSWPAASGFTACRPVEESGRIDLPSTTSNSIHIGFLIRARQPADLRIDRLTVTYDAVDAFFVLFPPKLAAHHTSPSVVLTPTRSTTVAAQPHLVPGQRPASAIHVEMTQEGHALRSLPPNTLLVGQPRGPVTLGRPVVVHIRNSSRRGLMLGLEIEWA